MITKTPVNEDILKAQLQDGEMLAWLCKDKRTNDFTRSSCYTTDYLPCKNGHMCRIDIPTALENNVVISQSCNECGVLIFEYVPFAVRYRELSY